MITPLQSSLRALVQSGAALPADALDIRFATPTSEWVSSLTRPTLNFFLHDVHENTELRRMDFVQHVSSSGSRRSLPPRRMEVQFLVTMFSKSQSEESSADEGNVLWRVLTALLRNEEWPDEFLPEDVRALGLGIRGLVKNADKVNYDLFSNLGLKVRPHVNYAVTVPLDLEVTEFSPLVLERRIGLTSGLENLGSPQQTVTRSAWQIRNKAGELVVDALVRSDGGARGFTDGRGVVTLPVTRGDVKQLTVLTLSGESFKLKAADALYRPEGGAEA